MKLIIVGGVAGGASAAARARRLSEDAEIIVFERGPDVSFANCGLPYYIGGQIAERDKLLVTTPERLRERFRLDVRNLSTVESIDRLKKSVSVRDHRNQTTYEETYDKLILATGAAPFLPAQPGFDLPGVFTLRNLQDTDRIKQAVQAGANHAVLLGGGFINLELAENFVHLGIHTTIVEKNAQLLTPFDKEMTTPILAELRRQGVKVLLGNTVETIQRSAEGLRLQLNNGQHLVSQVVGVGMGVRPENHLARHADLAIGVRGGIQVNRHMQTSDPAIYAVGDAVEVIDTVTGAKGQVPLAGPANRQGRIAADHAMGRNTCYRGTQGTAIIGVFGCTAAITGASEKSLQSVGRPFRKVYLHPAHHAGYYPGAQGMSIKVLFEPDTGKILGAQAVGGLGVDKRIDVLAIAIQAGLTVFDLEESELAYAPQFGSAKDPINMAGFVAAGLLRGDHPQRDWEVVLALTDAQRPILLDVRTAAEFATGSVPGALNIPVDELRDRLAELPRDRKIATFCQVGQRGYLATRILLQNGLDAANLGGGYKTYRLFHPDVT